jgi:hypothetical protein
MVLAAAMVHPFSLRMATSLLVHQDKIFPSDVLLVPRFVEDRNGELYQEAFREFWAGNGKMIYVEDDQVLGMSVKEIVSRMAKQRGIKEDVVRKLDVAPEDKANVLKVRERLGQAGVKKVILIVPEYASKRYHLLYGAETANDKVIFLVKPVTLSYFNRGKWWANESSRGAMQRELYALGSYYLNRFKYGSKTEETEKR